MLLFEARWLDVPACSRGEPNPSLFWSSSIHPAHLQDRPDSGSKGKYSPCGFCFAVRDEQGTVAAVYPGDCLPAEPVAFFWSHSSVCQNTRNSREQIRR